LDKVDWSSPKLRDALNKQAEELLHAMDRLEPGSVWPQARTMMLRKAEAAEWKAELKEQTCSTLVLGYCGKVAVEQYHFVDVALRVKDPALCASLLELARKEPVTKCIVTTMYNPLIVLALNGAGKPVAAFTMTNGSMQPIRVGRHDGRWVFDNWFMPPVYNLRLRNRGLEIMLRNMVGEAGRLTDD
jgi:hypothetical protein